METPPARPLNLRPWLIALALLGAIVVAAQRIWLAYLEPLWLDEAWTGAIVSAPDWRSFAREAWLDPNAPLYYLMMRFWTAVFGLSNLALRAPGLMAVAAAAAIPLLIRLKGLSLEARLAWAAMLFFWWRVDVFLDARCYGLLLALCTLQCVIFGRLLLRPSLAAALTWGVVAAAAILCQYYAGFLVLTQGLAYLALCRGRALRTWPAALAFAPVAAWIAWHLPRLRLYADPALAWHDPVGARQALDLAAFTVDPAGAPFVLAVGAVLAGAAFLSWRSVGEARDEPAQPSAHLWWIVGCGVAALALALLSGAWRGTITARYLMPVAPAVLLGLVLAARATRRAHLAYLALVGAYLAAAINPHGFAAAPTRVVYGHQAASELLMRRGVSQVVFVWDHEASPIMDPVSLRRVGGFFFRRAGYPVTVVPLNVTPRTDVSRAALAAARGPRPGIIWVFNRAARTAARASPPRIAELDRAWSCESFSDEVFGAKACWRRPAR